MDIVELPKSISKEIGRGTILDRWRLPDGTLYLDNAATRPMLPEVAEEMARLMANNPLNASSQHKYGQKAARMLEDARNFFKSELNVPSTGELIFNSGATEGLNMLLKSAYFADPTKNHIVTVKTEHKAVLNTCAYLETIGAEVTYLDVDEWGQVSVSDIEAALRPTTCAVCVMWVNNETGVISSIGEIGEICRKSKVMFLCDGTQAFGKMSMDMRKLGVDGFVFSGHKLGGAIGSGGVCWSSPWVTGQIFGGGQEFGKRGGTISLGAIRSMEMAYVLMPRVEASTLQKARSVFQGELVGLGSEVRLESNCVDWIMNFEFNSCSYPSDTYGLVIGRGSACNSGLESISHVGREMNFSEGVYRVSF